MRYRPAVDVLRLLSAALIVCFHSPESPYKSFTIAGLSYFVLLTFCLQGLGEEDGRPYPLRDRARRLLVPWLAFSAFYLLLDVARQRSVLPALAKFLGNPALILGGPEIHLWYLPFAFFGGIAAFFLKRAATRLGESGGLIALLVVAGALATLTSVAARLVFPFGQWAYSLPLLPIGLAIGMAQRLPGGRLAGHYAAILAVTAATAWSCREASFLLGGLALAISILPRGRDLPVLRRLAGLSLGIYLLHPFFLFLVYKYLPGATWPVFTAIGLIGSAALSGLIARAPRLDGLIFGTTRRPGRAPQGPRPAAIIPAPFEATLARPAP